jgi:hypothetical protein
MLDKSIIKKLKEFAIKQAVRINMEADAAFMMEKKIKFVDKEFYFKKWVMNLYADIQNVYGFKTQSEPSRLA